MVHTLCGKLPRSIKVSAPARRCVTWTCSIPQPILSIQQLTSQSGYDLGLDSKSYMLASMTTTVDFLDAATGEVVKTHDLKADERMMTQKGAGRAGGMGVERREVQQQHPWLLSMGMITGQWLFTVGYSSALVCTVKHLGFQ